jgi:hypothetical protein
VNLKQLAGDGAYGPAVLAAGSTLLSEWPSELSQEQLQALSPQQK